MPKLKLGGKICPKFKMGGEKKRGGKTPDWGGQIFQNFFEGGKTHFSPPFLDPCACMIPFGIVFKERRGSIALESSIIDFLQRS